MKALKIILCVAIAVIVPAGTFIGLGLYNLKKICYKVSDIVLDSITFKTAKLILKIKVKNPSSIAVNITGYDFAIQMNGVEVAKITNSDKKELGAGQVSELSVPLTIQLDKVYDVAKSVEMLGYFLTRQMSKIVLTLNGEFRGSVLKVPVSTGVNFSYNLEEIKKIAAEPGMPCDV